MKTLALLILSSALTFAADISGKWSFDVEVAGQTGSPIVDFEQHGETLSGIFHGRLGESKLTGTVKGAAVEFTLDLQGMTVKYSGKLDGASKMSGTCDYGEAAGQGTFTAVKN